MALITSGSSLNQGQLNNVADLAFTLSGTGAANRTVITGATTLPALADNEWFEIRNAALPGNNGLYRVNDASPTTSSVTAEKFTGPNPVNDTAESTDILGTTGASTEKSVMFDTAGLQIWLLEQGNLSSDGVIMLALHSFAKDEWKSDAFLIAAAAFPIVGISFAAGQWQFGTDPSGNNSGWKPAEDLVAELAYTRRLIRNAGWDEIDANGVILKKQFNVTTLPTTGAFEDAADQAYYRFGSDPTDTGAAIDFAYPGEVNEPVEYFNEIGNPDTLSFATTSTITRATGSFVTDGFAVGSQVTIRNADQAGNNGTFLLTGVAALTLTLSGTPLTVDVADTNAQLAVDHSNAFEAFLRIRDADPKGKTFAFANLAAGGETEIASKIVKLGLANATDNDIDATDAQVSGNSPWTQIKLRYLAAAYNRAVDSATLRDYGIVADVGTYSQSNGVSNGTVTFTSADWPSEDTLADFAGGTLILHDATGGDRTTHTISGTPTAPGGVLTITLTAALTNSDTAVSFTMQRATPITASKQQIYEKIQYQLRQASDIDQTSNTVVGKTASPIAAFSGPDLKLGETLPTNPNGGGSGVIVEGFDANDTNNLFFFDNTGVSRNYPFVAAGNIVANQGLVDDTDGEAWLYFEYTRRVTNSDIDTVTPAGDSYTLTGTLGTYLVNDYIWIQGFAQAENNGLFIVEVVNVSGSSYDMRKVDGTNVGTAETNQTVSLDENPYPSPQGTIVNDNSGSPIAFAINALTTPWDFDYENNVQGGRTADTDAAVVLVAAGAENAQVAVVKNLVIQKTTGQNFSVTSGLERNYAI